MSNSLTGRAESAAQTPEKLAQENRLTGATAAAMESDTTETPASAERGTNSQGQPAWSGPTEITPTAKRAIAILLAASFVVLLNETTMNLALRNITADPQLGIGARSASWLTAIFMLVMAIVIPTTGWMQRRLNTRPMFLMSTISFLAGTVIAFAAPTFSVLLAGRVVQAFGTAIAMPLLMSTVMAVVPMARRGSIMGIVSMVISVAPALGPVVAGVVLQFGSWRAVFGTMIPIALAVIAAGYAWLPNLNEFMGKAKLDYLSVPFSALGFGGTIYGLSSISNPDLPTWLAPTVLVIGLLSLGVFVWRQLRLAKGGEPLLDVRVFANLRFTAPVLMVMLAMMGMFGVLITLPLMLQTSFGLEPYKVGMLLLPGSVISGLLGPIVGNLYDRVGPRPLAIPGTAVVVGSFAMLLGISTSTSVWYFLAFHIIMNIGLAFTFSPSFTTALGSLNPRQYGYGSASMSTAQQIAGAAGSSIFIAIMSTGMGAAIAGGATEGAAMVTGAHRAFIFALVIEAIVFALSFTLRRPRH
ncbi:DHA2 family lincomycin resistance protein-like MFS transporter [Arcanobacterium wilhelmae]|uniref:DHA2 family lincomycin resistance protein-like MFS transporter n=1 Tax=Arcanobacterium wilhelmae TaxID=1803177 RepID=A0ABT9NC41_9ACTO|nr:DHA2 family efflux MFS transporter permease subunit [Arcanobacterium wilhelmae]MDP9801274.1 DHA2 family lincomycin resistance protein-like MFS transporter [Arcanobacterium wilhelmae]WFN90620.1 DHA2 family efflux MFS transporter permease subunit [Arcanobacterium wilhelmae]